MVSGFSEKTAKNWYLNDHETYQEQFVINGRNMPDVFRERIGEVKEWMYREVAGMGR